MIAYFLYGLFFISCLVLIATVLLQPGKSDAGALFTSNISSTAFGPRGTQSVLSKITITAAATFMLSALLLSMPAITGNVSVLQTTSETAPATAPANTAANSASGNVANSNVAVNSTAASSNTANTAGNTSSNTNTNK